jgi:ribosomal protein S18 acetylase RimI-like enzyme
VLDRDLIGIFDLVTSPAHRRRGYGAALVASLLEWGFAHGARTAYLQVVKSNAAASALYRKLGFTEAYQYWYRIRARTA